MVTRAASLSIGIADTDETTKTVEIVCVELPDMAASLFKAPLSDSDVTSPH